MPVIIEIPDWRPARINEFVHKHWAVGHRKKKADRDMLAMYSRGKPKPEWARQVDMEITLKGKQQEADPDSYWKSLLDGLVHAGMLIDDRGMFCRLGQVTYKRGDATHTTIILTDLPKKLINGPA